MAAFCILAGGCECTGCGRCEQQVSVGVCAACGESITAAQDHYHIALPDILLHEDCLRDYFAKDLVIA